MKKKINDIIIDNKPNSDMSPKERRLMELINGAEPKDESEKQIVKEFITIYTSVAEPVLFGWSRSRCEGPAPP